jgi:hypothetical protein
MVRSITRALCIFSGLLVCTNADASNYAFSQANGSITFHNKASLHEFDGQAKSFSGSLDTAAGTGSLTVRASSLTTNFGARDSKMHESCLESGTYTTIKFAVSSIGGDAAGLQSGEGSGTVTLKGTLSIRSISHSVAITTNYTYNEGALRLQGNYPMKWGDYGVPDPSIFVSKLYPDMTVGFNVNLQAQ